jgi:hypothetical protein
MLYPGLDLSRKRLDFHLLDADGATVEVGAAPPDADGLHRLTQRLDRYRTPICAAIESMNGARFVLPLFSRRPVIDSGAAQLVVPGNPCGAGVTRVRRPRHGPEATESADSQALSAGQDGLEKRERGLLFE